MAKTRTGHDINETMHQGLPAQTVNSTTLDVARSRTNGPFKKLQELNFTEATTRSRRMRLNFTKAAASGHTQGGYTPRGPRPQAGGLKAHAGGPATTRHVNNYFTPPLRLSALQTFDTRTPSGRVRADTLRLVRRGKERSFPEQKSKQNPVATLPDRRGLVFCQGLDDVHSHVERRVLGHLGDLRNT